MMARFKLVGLTLVAAFAILAVVSASASALQWLLNGKPIEKAVTVTSSGTLLLADLSAPGGGTYIICKGTDKGTIGPLAHDEVTSIPNPKCEFQSGKSGSCTAGDEVKAEALNLPWLTLLITVNGKTRDALSTHTGKNPGWNVTCTVAGIIKVQDECTSATGEPSVANLAAGVDTTFEESETASCTQGNATSGMVIGTDLNENPTGSTISVSNSPNT
jgi:hypothetical protein